jgi:hypothetical protein
MWPISIITCSISLSYLTLCNTSSFFTRSAHMIFFVLLQQDISNFQGISYPLSEVSNFQNLTKLSSKCNSFSLNVEVRYYANNVMTTFRLSTAIYCRHFLPLELLNGLLFCSFGDDNVNNSGKLRHEAVISVWRGTEPYPLCRTTQVEHNKLQRCTAILCINSLQVVKIVSASLLSLKWTF